MLQDNKCYEQKKKRKGEKFLHYGKQIGDHSIK